MSEFGRAKARARPADASGPRAQFYALGNDVHSETQGRKPNVKFHSPIGRGCKRSAEKKGITIQYSSRARWLRWARSLACPAEGSRAFLIQERSFMLGCHDRPFDLTSPPSHETARAGAEGAAQRARCLERMARALNAATTAKSDRAFTHGLSR
eukprot:2414251-Pyramimonas_sp.AAC.1